MQKYLRQGLITLALFGSAATSAASLPTGYDEFRAANGAMCRSTTASDSYVTLSGYGEENGDAGVQVEVTIPLTGTRDRLDCNRLYNLEMERLELDNARMKAELERLKNQQTTWD